MEATDGYLAIHPLTKRKRKELWVVNKCAKFNKKTVLFWYMLCIVCV